MQGRVRQAGLRKARATAAPGRAGSSVRRANPNVPWALVWVALGLIIATALIAFAAIALAAPRRASARSGSEAGCPRSDQTLPVSRRPGARSELVPPGAQALLICRYSGLRSSIGRPYVLLASKLVQDAAEAQRTGRELNALRPPPRGLFCPANFADAIVVHVLYATGVDDPVTIELSGCQTVSNGLRTARSGPVALRLAALVPEPATATLSGRVQLCGGPGPGTCRAMTTTWCASPRTCLKADRIWVAGDAPMSFAVPVSGGAFGPVPVPPGRYTVELLGDNARISGRVLLTQRITLEAGESLTILFGFDIR